MLEFLQTPAGRAVLGVFIAAVIIVITELNYRIFAKAVLDFLFAFIAVIVLSPSLIALACIARVKAGKCLESKAYMGGKGKIIYLHTFAGIKGCAKYLARIFDVLGGRLSLVGVKPLEVIDGALIDDENMDRFIARPGIVCHMISHGAEDATYEDMFDSDARYAKKREFFTDVFMVLKGMVYAIRGEGKSYLGEAENNGYAQTLLSRGAITEGDFKRAEKYAEETLENMDREDPLKSKYNNL